MTFIDDLNKQFPDQFDRIGSFEGKASLFLKRDAREHRSTHDPSAASTSRRDCNRNSTLRRTTGSYERSSITQTGIHSSQQVKKDGSQRVCLDHKRLNDNLKRCPLKIPTLEELNPAFAEARVFSKMGAKAGY